MVKQFGRQLYEQYKALGYPLLPITRLIRGPMRWFYHRSPFLRHDVHTYLRPRAMSVLHQLLVVDHPVDYRIYHDQIRFRSYGSLMSVQGYYVGEIEYHLIQFLVKQIKPDMVMLDVGAHHGVYTLVAAYELRQRGWQGVIHSFEPDPRNFALLEYNIRQNKLDQYVVLHNAAVADVVGTQPFISFVTENSGNTLAANKGLSVPEDIEQAEGVLTQSVEVVTLDSFLDQLPPVTLIKLDVQGSEPRVLMGAEKIIARDRPILAVELIPDQPVSGHIRTILYDYAYTLCGVTKQGLLCALGSPEAFVSWDVIGLPGSATLNEIN